MLLTLNFQPLTAAQVMPCTKTLYYNVSEDTAYARLKGRSATSGRVDDNDDTIHKCFLVFM
jgi:hypothetical protein